MNFKNNISLISIKKKIYNFIFFSHFAPLLLPIVILFNNNLDLLTIRDLNIIFVIILFFYFIITIVSYFPIIKKINLSNVFSCLLILNLFSNYLIFKNNLIKFEDFFLLNFFFISIYLIIFLKKKTIIQTFIKFINISTYIFLIITMINYINYDFNSKEIKFVNNYFSNLSLKRKPDIYHIIPDGLVSIDTAKKYKFYNDNEFTKVLKNNGLISLKSYANYPTTFASIPSMLNGSIFSPQTEVIEKNFYKLNSSPSFINMLYKNGYDIIWFENHWIGTKCKNKNFICPQKYRFDEILDNEIVSEYLKILNFNYDWNEKLLKIFNINKLYYLDNIQKQLDQLDYSKKSKPKYIFSHLMTPHMPYKVDQNCRPIYLTGESPKWSNKKYFKEMECFKKQLINFHNFVKSKKRPYILIISSDTGWTFNDDFHPSTNQNLNQWHVEQFRNFIVINESSMCFDKNREISNAEILPFMIACVNNAPLPKIDNRAFDSFYYDAGHPLAKEFIHRNLN